MKPSLLNAARVRPLSHPWNRGFKNNRFLRSAAGDDVEIPHQYYVVGPNGGTTRKHRKKRS